METLYRKVAVSDIEKLKEVSLTTKKRSGEYRTALSHVLNLPEVPDNEESLLKQNKELTAWKKEAMEVMTNFQLQEIGKVLNLKLGSSISEQTLPAIKKLKADKAELLEALEIFIEQNTPTFTSHDYEFPEHVMRAKSLIQKHKS